MAQNELFISVIGADDLYNTEFLTRQDPFVIVTYGGHEVHRTKVAEDQGVNPAWNDKFCLKMIPNTFDIRFMVWNKNHITGDAEIGATQVHFAKALTTGLEDFSATVFHNDKPKGKLRLIFDYPYARTAGPQGYGGYPQPMYR
eukprot:TRINITY_DN1119_c0_g3_i1.p2 TRINITY_DN1119_c0_g3~~TRINITY_DN1119_c0_g3_i1.p2  ORF type:complete len:143 (-),score=15.20 TRINITY_DN1119_c0_g3_i1:748-1176(-)